MSNDQTPAFLIAIEDKVAYLDLNRPNEGNVLTRGMMTQLARDIRTLGARREVHAIAIKGRGTFFCKGHDGRDENSIGLSAHEMGAQMTGPVLGVYDSISEVPIPVIACVHGAAVGFGAALAGACDVTLMSSTASFAFPEINHGVAPTLAMSSVRRSISAKALAYLVYSGEAIEAAHAMAIGLASQVWGHDLFTEASRDFLATLASRPRLILETIKRHQTKSEALSC